jgi:hypothetical protein
MKAGLKSWHGPNKKILKTPFSNVALLDSDSVFLIPI